MKLELKLEWIIAYGAREQNWDYPEKQQAHLTAKVSLCLLEY